ncbi:MAG: hypothetical protein ACC707_15085 [Thiohalomonadales bacterium]
MTKIKYGVLLVFLATIAFSTSPLMAADGTKKTVKEVLSESAKLSGKKVIVTGKVIKVNNGIMKRNFLHIQDGTSLDGTDKVIVTSNQTATVGQQVTVTGTVVLDTDFGFGYKYPLLIEKSNISVNK